MTGSDRSRSSGASPPPEEKLSRSQREATPQGADRLQAMAQHAVPPGRRLPGQGQHVTPEEADSGKLPEHDPHPEEK
jgi:hypothetical protein